MRRISPALVVFGSALVASICIHVPIYGALGILAEALQAQLKSAQPEASIELDFDILENTASEPAARESAQSKKPTREHERPKRPNLDPPTTSRNKAISPQTTETRRPKLPEPVVEPELEAEPESEPIMPPAPSPPREEPPNLQAVQVKSTNPEVEPPADTQYIAESNNRVEEETRAEITNLVQDDEHQAASRAPRERSPNHGDGDEDLLAEMRDMEGSEQRAPTERETLEERPETSSDDVLPPVARGNGRTENDGSDTEETPETASETSSASTEGGDSDEPLVLSDGFGAIRIEQSAIRGAGSGTRNDVDRDRASEAQDRRTGRSGSQGMGAGLGNRGPDRRAAWSNLSSLLGQEQLDQEREAYVRERRSRRRGSSSQNNWNEFRAALENFTPSVRPGNQTALNTRASPFANYLAAVHRRIHREFAGRFLRSLPTVGTHPFAEPSLRSKLEIVINQDGSIERIAIVRSSGYLPFDHGAFTSVMRGQPYPTPPAAILSGDSRVYFHWGFYRNHRQCGTFNAEPYILPNPPNAGSSPVGPTDEPRWGSSIPSAAAPTWGTSSEPGTAAEDSSASEVVTNSEDEALYRRAAEHERSADEASNVEQDSSAEGNP
ncbi:MAG: TonB C-terminal domain-containing protein [Myxococcota bacterium]